MKFLRGAVLAFVITALSPIAPAPRAHAQDTGEIFSGAQRSADSSSSQSASNSDEEQSNSRGGGCLCGGNVDNSVEGPGTVAFIFHDDQLNYFSFYWNAQNFAYGPAQGSVTRRSVQFIGRAGDDCTVTGSGRGHDFDPSGKFNFHGECAKVFGSGAFSFARFVFCSCTYDPKAKGWQAND